MRLRELNKDQVKFVLECISLRKRESVVTETRIELFEKKVDDPLGFISTDMRALIVGLIKDRINWNPRTKGGLKKLKEHNPEDYLNISKAIELINILLPKDERKILLPS